MLYPLHDLWQAFKGFLGVVRATMLPEHLTGRRDFSGDLEIGGPTLAAGFIRRGLVDEYALVVHPVILGGGTPFFPDLERPAGLRLLETRRFSSGAVYLGFAVR
jgi:dihydrofolate reductase